MKLIILYICLAAISLHSYGQGKVLWKNVDGTPMGDVVEVHRHKYHRDLFFEALIENVSKEDKKVLLKRTIDQYISNANGQTVADLLCYGESCQTGFADIAELTTAPTLLNAGNKVNTLDAELIHFSPNENKGTAIINYIILTETDKEDVYQEEDRVKVKYIVEPYVRTSVTFKVDMTSATGFNADNYDVFVSINETKEEIKLTKKRTALIYYKSVELDGNEEYTYTYCVKKKDGSNDVAEQAARTLELGPADKEVEDSWQIATGLETNDLETVNCYPNPFDSSLTITGLTKKIVSIEIINLTGAIVYHSAITGSRMTISTENLSSGYYIIRTKSTSGVSFNKKIIKR